MNVQPAIKSLALIPLVKDASSRRARYLAQIEVRIAGIPCLAGVTEFSRVDGSLSADNPCDYYGYVDLEYDVLDRRGRPAAWLERKLGDDDRQDIEERIVRAFS